MTTCASPFGPFTDSGALVEQQFDFFTTKVNTFLNAANEFSQILASYEIEPVSIQEITWDIDAGFTPFEPPAEPADFVAPDPQFFREPPAEAPPVDVDLSGLNSVSAPSVSAPSLPTLNVPSAPVVNLPTDPGPAPVIGDVEIPQYTGGPLPDVPTLYQLNLPDVPDINIDDLQVTRPSFVPPNALDDTYRPDLIDFRSLIWTAVEGEIQATGVQDMQPRLQAMLAGGTGLPAPIEQALFDRAIGRDEVSSAQAEGQASQEWAARGFDLPGSTLLARTQEARRQNRIERGRINRELSIQFHDQELQNLRFAVQQAIAYEGQLMQAHTQIYDVARSLADGHFQVARAIHQAELDIFRVELEIYRTDVEVYKERLQAELVKLEIYRSELEGQRIIGQLNQQLVDIYQAELQGVLANVEIFRAQVQGAEAQIRAEVAKLDGYRAKVDAYSARLGAERVRADIYNAQVEGEVAKARMYEYQVRGFSARIDAYQTQVNAEAAKVDANVRVAEADTRLYAEQVSAWRAGVQADTDNLRAFVDVYRARIEQYNALLSREQYRVQGEARNFELEIESERARVSSILKQADQAIAQLEHISALGLSATETAARVNSQLAASAMSAINVGASVSASASQSASDSRSCSTNYSGIL